MPFVLWMLVVCALADPRHSGTYAPRPLCLRDRQQPGGGGLCRHSGGVSYHGGVCYRRDAHGAGGYDRSVAADDRPADRGQGYELQAIAAVIIGGGSLHGGEGSVVGTLIGAFIMGLLSNGSDLLGVSPYLQQAIIGGVIILAVTVDELRKRRTV